MSTYKGSNNITYNSINKNLLSVGAKITATPYIINDNDEIVFHLPIINAIDIDWNNAYLPSLNTYIKTTEDLLHQLEVIYGSINNIDLSNYVTNDVLESKGYLTEARANVLYAPKSVENDITQIYGYLDTKANADAIPKNISDLGGYSSLATQVWVNNQLRYYSRSAYDVYVDNGGTLTQSEWLASLHGTDGVNGKSAYELYRQHGGYLTETQWLDSLQGKDGWSSYQIAKNNNPNIGTEEEWIASLKGEKGDPGQDGKSAYQLAQDKGFEGTEEEWIASLKGAKGERGDKGETGASINILGYYETLDELKAATEDTINSLGDAYNVGGVFYTYNDQFTSIDDKWKFAGSIQGNDGKSAYELAKLHGFEGTEGEWIASLKGEKGEKGETGERGETGEKGEKGRSAYDIAQGNGFEGTETEWLASLKGATGETGPQGPQGQPGASAFEQARSQNPEITTMTEWLASLKGEKGDSGQNGKSAFEIYRQNGGTLQTEQEWLDSLKGKDGQTPYEIYKNIQIALGNTYLDETTWNNQLANIKVYTAGSGINISDEGVISAIPRTLEDMWIEVKE